MSEGGRASRLVVLRLLVLLRFMVVFLFVRSCFNTTANGRTEKRRAHPKGEQATRERKRMERAACCAHCASGHKGVSDEAILFYEKGNGREYAPCGTGMAARHAT